MGRAKTATSPDPEALKQVDQFVDLGIFPNPRGLIQDAVSEELRDLRRSRLSQECAKLQPSEEKAVAEEFFQGEAEWSEF